MIVFFGGKVFKTERITGEMWAASIGIGALSIPWGACIRLIPRKWFWFLKPVKRERRVTPEVEEKGQEKSTESKANASHRSLDNELKFFKALRGSARLEHQRLGGSKTDLNGSKKSLLATSGPAKSRKNSIISVKGLKPAGTATEPGYTAAKSDVAIPREMPMIDEAPASSKSTDRLLAKNESLVSQKNVESSNVPSKAPSTDKIASPKPASVHSEKILTNAVFSTSEFKPEPTVPAVEEKAAAVVTSEPVKMLDPLVANKSTEIEAEGSVLEERKSPISQAISQNIALGDSIYNFTNELPPVQNYSGSVDLISSTVEKSASIQKSEPLIAQKVDQIIHDIEEAKVANEEIAQTAVSQEALLSGTTETPATQEKPVFAEDEEEAPKDVKTSEIELSEL